MKVVGLKDGEWVRARGAASKRGRERNLRTFDFGEIFDSVIDKKAVLQFIPRASSVAK